jgi:NTE family protein
MSAPAADGRTALLAHIPLFQLFGPGELETLADLFVDVSYRRGDTICSAGEEGDTFFVCVSGELEVVAGRPPRVVNRLGPGASFGEISLLLGGKRAATVKATRTTRLLALNKAAFDRYFLHNAKVLAHLSRELSRQLATTAAGVAVPRTTTVISISAARLLRGATLVANGLAALLRDHSGHEVVLLRCGSPAGAIALGELARRSTDELWSRLDRSTLEGVPLLVARADQGEAVDEALSALLSRLGERARFVVLHVAAGRADLERAAEDAADVLVRIVDAARPPAPDGAGPRTFGILNLYNPSTSPIPVNHCEPFVLRVDPGLRELDVAGQLARIRSAPRSPAAAALHRLARKILGSTVGIVLGGGAAFGMAHIGVLKVLEDNGIPADLVVGCSMGSLIAIGLAAGMRASDMHASALRLGTKRNVLWALTDLTLTKPGLLNGQRFLQLLLPLIEPLKDFNELLLPCRVVATDIQTGERVTIGSGSLAHAGRASCSIPMVFRPIEHEGHILVDGGVVDPVPAEVVHDMGADVCIAVNAVPPLRKGVETVLARWYRQVNPFSWLAFSRDMPNMFDVVMNSMQSLQHELGNFKAISADVRICPDLSEFTWIEFYRPKEIVERGIEAAERALPEIRRVLAERGLPQARGEAPAAGEMGGKVAPARDTGS